MEISIDKFAKKIFHRKGLEKTIKSKLASTESSGWPTSRRSAYGGRSTVHPTKHKVSNKRSCLRSQKSWLSIRERPSLFVQHPYGLRGFNERSTVRAQGITRGKQVRSFV